jgi:hypothetical protein
MRFHHWTKAASISKTVFTSLFMLENVGELSVFGMVFQLSTNNMAFQLYVDNVLWADCDLQEFFSQYNLDGSNPDAPKWLYLYSTLRWQMEFPEPIKCSKIEVKMKSQTASDETLHRGFLVRL